MNPFMQKLPDLVASLSTTFASSDVSETCTWLAAQLSASEAQADAGRASNLKRSEKVRAGIRRAVGPWKPENGATFVWTKQRLQRDFEGYGLKRMPSDDTIKDELRQMQIALVPLPEPRSQHSFSIYSSTTATT